LREAEKLIGLRIHPQTIVEGYRIASAAALKALEEAAVDHGYVACVSLLFCLTTLGFYLPRSDTVTFRKDLMNIARTTLSSKVLSQDKDYFSNLAVDAVLRLKVRVLSERVWPIACYSWCCRDQQTWIIFRSSKKSAES